MLPDAETLLQLYFNMPSIMVVYVLLFFIGISIYYYLGYSYGYNKALTYIWENGIEHSKREHRKLYVKWSNKIQ